MDQYIDIERYRQVYIDNRLQPNLYIGNYTSLSISQLVSRNQLKLISKAVSKKRRKEYIL